MSGKYPNSGALFPREASGKQPNYKGNIELDETMCDYIHQQFRAGNAVVLDLAGWTRAGQKGEFISVSIQIPFKKNDDRSRGGDKFKDMEDDIPF